MFIDSRSLKDREVISTEVCIVGAGPAGISIAKEFLNKSFKVCLLESGDVEANTETAALAEAESCGDPFSPLRDMRHRQFGGMSNVWNVILHAERIGVRYVDFDAIDFEKRDWIPYSGWPISKKDLVPYYERAHKLCQLGSYNYSTLPWETGSSPPVRISGDRITSSIFKFGPSNIFNTEYRRQIDSSSNITTYTNANAVEIVLHENARSVKCIHTATLAGNKFTVNAKYFILAAGGTENPRLLLLSNKVQANGVGNQHDVVGRYFMDHPLVYAGLLFPRDKNIFSSMALYDKRRMGDETIMGKFSLTESALRREKMLHMSVMLFPRDKSFKSETKASAEILFSSLRRRKVPPKALTHLRNVAFNGDQLIKDWYKYHVKKDVVKPNLAHGEWSKERSPEQKYVKFEAVAQTEQAPHPDNRVTLSDRLDKLGYRQVKLTNYWNEIDKESVKKAESIYAEDFAASGLGEMKIEPLEKQRVMLSTHHNMGTTRMSDDPRYGVVDADCKVHGISNLYVAGSSVFPTGGFANPTLTIIALAIRMADNILRKMN
jgi:choline dehydrogenase-like flavoprotein